MKDKNYHTIYFIVNNWRKIRMIQLSKTLFLSDYRASQELGVAITDFEYKLYYSGPYSRNIQTCVDKMTGREIEKIRYVDGQSTGIELIAGNSSRINNLGLSSKEKDVILDVIKEYRYEDIDRIVDDVLDLDIVQQIEALGDIVF